MPDRSRISCYLPPILFREAEERRDSSDDQSLCHICAAVLYCDISGFTPIVEQMTQRGAVGIEDLSHLLNEYTGNLINRVVAHGGEVAGFAGDALCAMWHDPEADAHELSRRAAWAALDLQENQNFTPAAGRLLSVKLALTTGDVQSADVQGRFERRYVLIGGPPFAEIARLMKIAVPGQVVVSKEVLQLLGDAAHESIGGSGFSRLLRLPNPPVQRHGARRRVPGIDARPYLSPAVLHRLDAGQEDWLAELRRISVAFFSIPRFEFTPEFFAKILWCVEPILARYEGLIDKFFLDEKGLNLMVVFGLPPFAHEDDPVRCIEAAGRIHAALADLGMAAAIGVSTGRAFCGPIGNDMRRSPSSATPSI